MASKTEDGRQRYHASTPALPPKMKEQGSGAANEGPDKGGGKNERDPPALRKSQRTNQSAGSLPDEPAGGSGEATTGAPYMSSTRPPAKLDPFKKKEGWQWDIGVPEWARE